MSFYELTFTAWQEAREHKDKIAADFFKSLLDTMTIEQAMMDMDEE